MRQLYTEIRTCGSDSAEQAARVREMQALQQTNAASRIPDDEKKAKTSEGLGLLNNLLARMQGATYLDDLNPNAFGSTSFGRGANGMHEAKVGVLFNSDEEAGFAELKAYLDQHGIEYTEYNGLGRSVGLTIRNDYNSSERSLDRLIETLQKENLPQIELSPEAKQRQQEFMEQQLYGNQGHWNKFR